MYVCENCVDRPMYRSRLQGSDWLPLLVLMVPLRCHRCRKRIHVFWPKWLLSGSLLTDISADKGRPKRKRLI